jgi:hypothetical protein
VQAPEANAKDCLGAEGEKVKHPLDELIKSRTL